MPEIAPIIAKIGSKFWGKIAGAAAGEGFEEAISYETQRHLDNGTFEEETPFSLKDLLYQMGVAGAMGALLGGGVHGIDALSRARNSVAEAGGAGKTLNEGAWDVGKIPWDSWQNYEKVTANGQEYAKVGNRLYSKHAVDRMQPSGKRFTVGDAIVQAGGVSGRSVAPQFVEDVIKSVEPVFQPATGIYVYTSGTVKIVTNEYGYVVTIMTVGR